jgi:Mrp family chromosome partitioning ATPase
MARGRAKLLVLAEIAGPPADEAPAWGIRERDFEALARPLAELDRTGDLLVTGGGEEQRVLAITLAAVAAAGGRRTILVECDVGRPRLAAELGLAAEPGLHEYLRWEAAPNDLLQPVVLAGSAAAAEEPLVCVAAGRAAADPATLLGLGSFRHMTAKLREAYELRVLLGPALGNGGTALAAVAAEAEALLLALPPEYGSGERAKTVATVARRLGPRTLGAVLVGDSPSGDQRS